MNYFVLFEGYLGKRSSKLAFLFYIVFYVVMLVWFKAEDVYHKHFSEPGLSIVFYNCFRICFVVYLFLIIETVGSLTLAFLFRCRAENAGCLERCILNFYAGAGVLQIVILLLGHLSLLTVPVFITITVPLVALSFFEYRSVAQHLRLMYRAGSLNYSSVFGFLSLAVIAVGLLLTKGLFPGAGHDYINHYFPYDQAVIANGSLWPNDVWYHYFYSKGAGLFFLSILLTDPLGPQLVTLCFIFTAAATLFVAVRKIAPNSHWPLPCAVLFLGLYVVTPGWGEFEKLHELNCALVMGIVWLCIRAAEHERGIRSEYAIATFLALAAAILLNFQIGIIFVGCFGLLGALLLLLRRYEEGLLCWAFAICASFVVTLIGALNYVTTGMLIDQGLQYIWPTVNIEKLYQWGALPYVLVLYYGILGQVAEKYPLISKETLGLVALSFRLYSLLPLFVAGFATATLSICLHFSERRKIRFESFHFHLLLVSTLVLLFFGMCLSVGRQQPVSFERYSSFIIPLVIFLSAAFSCLALNESRRGIGLGAARHPATPWVVVLLCFVATASSRHFTGNTLRIVDTTSTAGEFAIGKISIDDAYVRQGKWAQHLPWGGIYPGVRGAYAIAGSNVAIWSMHIHTYCMLPNCRMETHFSFMMTRHWPRIMFGQPEDAQKELQEAGINYFLISKELDLYDPVLRSSLFSPSNIQKYFGVRWTDGTTTLLSWIGPATLPIDDKWLSQYRDHLLASPVVQAFPYEAMRGIFDRLNRMPHPWSSFSLPW